VTRDCDPSRLRGGHTAYAGHMQTILVVDDNPRAREILRRRLEPAGYRVAEAPGLDTAREQLRSAEPELVIVDLVLPGTVGGEQLIAELDRRQGRYHVVAISGAPERLAELRVRYPHLRALPKPFTTEQLLDAVKGALAEPARPTLRSRLAGFLAFLRPSA
jgi:two-component system cell cycle sensor histidine kinase/response regulator CckA